MTISVMDAVITPCRNILLDAIVPPATDGRYWKNAELLQYYNMFVTVAIGENPNAMTQQIQFQCAQGVEQVLDSSAVQFLKAPANVVSGRGITEVTAEAMQDGDPDWYSAPQTTDVVHVIPDPRDLRRFRVWPPNNGAGLIFLNEAYAPDDVTDPSQPFSLTEAYRNPAIACVLGMAFAKNTDRGDIQKSQYWFGMMDQRIAIKVKAEMQAQDMTGSKVTSE